MTTSADADAAPSPALRHAPLVALLLGLNIAVFVIQVLAGVDWRQPLTADLLAWGGNLASYTLTGEPSRLLTSMFLHVGVLHLALNMYMLAGLGPYVEQAFGKLRFLLLYLVSGMSGSIASALWHGWHRIDNSSVNAAGQLLQSSQLLMPVSVGASGALMGICGAFLGRILVSGINLQERHAIGMRGPLVQTIGINLLIGFLIPGIDDAAHIGGLIGGFLLGVMFTIFNFPYSRTRRTVAALAVSAASVALIYAAAVQEPSHELEAHKASTARRMAKLAHVPR